MARAKAANCAASRGRTSIVTEYNGVHGDFHWEIVGRTLKVFSGKRSVGLLEVFENVNAVNSEQAQWSAQAKIDLNLDALRAIEADKVVRKSR